MNLEKIYLKNFGENSNGWGSIESREIRFDMLKAIGIQPIHEVLDVGCGSGDFGPYIYKNHFHRHNYTGIDLRKDIVEFAQKQHRKFRYLNTSIYSIDGTFDYVVASGIFCFREPRWKNKVFVMLNKMLTMATKGVAVNFLRVHPLLHNPKPFMYYSTPKEIIEIAGMVTSEYVLRCDYKENDMTLYLYP